jgi:hypothetical protein
MRFTTTTLLCLAGLTLASPVNIPREVNKDRTGSLSAQECVAKHGSYALWTCERAIEDHLFITQSKDRCRQGFEKCAHHECRKHRYCCHEYREGVHDSFRMFCNRLLLPSVNETGRADQGY